MCQFVQTPLPILTALHVIRAALEIQGGPALQKTQNRCHQLSPAFLPPLSRILLPSFWALGPQVLPAFLHHHPFPSLPPSVSVGPFPPSPPGKAVSEECPQGHVLAEGAPGGSLSTCSHLKMKLGPSIKKAPYPAAQPATQDGELSAILNIGGQELGASWRGPARGEWALSCPGRVPTGDWALFPLFNHHSWLKTTYKTSDATQEDFKERVYSNSGAQVTGIYETEQGSKA